MAYWIKRILLKPGEIVTERELRPDENLFDGPPLVVGDKLFVTCRDRKFEARVIGEIGQDEFTFRTQPSYYASKKSDVPSLPRTGESRYPFFNSAMGRNGSRPSPGRRFFC